jgi:energy-coupling factor transporter ATP-binding protein EcfA2
MISDGRIYFLSRPRRFGKSLLVSALDELFSGKKELFERLFIYDKWDWSQKYPVIRLDWTGVNHSAPEDMKTSLCGYLNRIAQKYGIAPTTRTPPDCFRELIEQLHEKTGQKVVVLIDEYDKPVTSHLFDEHLAEIKTAVHDFYQVMKGADDHIRFAFLTGVSKFSGLSVFSALNNPNDITLNKKFAAICGYTQEELEHNFMEYIDAAADSFGWPREKMIERIRFFYDGYSWDGKLFVYNPFSSLRFFDEQRLKTYWFKTGTPTFLVEMLQRRNKTNLVLDNISIDDSSLDGYIPEKPEEIPLLFQTGYLTVKGIGNSNDGETYYTLGVPNYEVNEALLRQLLLVYGQYPAQDVNSLRNEIETRLRNCDEQGFADCLETLVASVPNELKMNCEAHYHALVLIWLRFLGFEVHPEVSNNLGRADAVWKQPDLTVIAELKYHKKKDRASLLAEAMKQIRERRYFNQTLGRILLLGIAFAGTEIACKMEVIER